MFLHEKHRGVKDKIFKGTKKGREKVWGGGRNENNEDDGALARFYARDLHTIGRFELER